MTDILSDLLAQEGKTRAQLMSESGPLAQVIRFEGIEDGPSLQRIRELPRREQATEELIDLLSCYLRTRPCDDDGEPNRLRPPQAEALCELFEVGGLFAPMRVGSGKTLVTLLAPTLMNAQRPVLMVPAALRDKTRREFAEYRRNWRVRLPHIVSYQEMGRSDKNGHLFELAPDLLILDEAHWARNANAAVTRRIRRYIEYAKPIVVCLSGTLITSKLMDYHHLMMWALQERAPVPIMPSEAERWAKALDGNLSTLNKIHPGALESLPGGFHAWMRGTRGVVPTPGSDCDAGIEMSTWTPKLTPELNKIIVDTAVTGMRPDGELLDEWELPDCLCQLALGFYYKWDPMPPEWWLRPRRGWRAYCKSILDEHLDHFDSESQIVNALDRKARSEPVAWRLVETPDGFVEEPTEWETRPHTGPTPPAAADGKQLLDAWRGVKDQFEPNSVPVWYTGDVVEQAVRSADKSCLIWVKYRAFGEALQRMGVPYYGGGTNPEAAAPGSTIALSIQAHSTGKNLQAWNRSLVTTPMAKAGAWEQLIGRTHRAKQKADTVYVQVINALEYHASVIDRVTSEARATSGASGFSQKLVEATWV